VAPPGLEGDARAGAPAPARDATGDRGHGLVPARPGLAGAGPQLAAPGGSIEVGYLAGLRLDEILREVGSLARGTVVLIGPFLRDATGRDFLTPEAIRRIAAASTVPVYGLTDNSVGTGIVGGQVVSFEAHGRVAAELALRVLAGERPPPRRGGPEE
jgi:hypothetical protein